MYLRVASWALYFSNVENKHVICPEALYILNLNSIDFELAAV